MFRYLWIILLLAVTTCGGDENCAEGASCLETDSSDSCECVCDPGLVSEDPENIACEPPPSSETPPLCEDVDCGENATCQADSGECACDDGFELGDEGCVSGEPEPIPNPFPVITDQFGKFAIVEIEGVVLTFRWIEPGTFSMGSPESEEGRFDNEGPVHQVTLTEGYWLAESEVTQQLWEAVMGDNPSEFGDENHPVERVSWNDIQEFLEEVNTQYPGLALKLPTEAQWEYAARAGTEGARYGELDEIAWYDENSGGTTHPVMEKTPNAWGLYDMLGNVEEWCHDASRNYRSDDEVDPIEPQGVGRVLRGSSADGTAVRVRAAYRRSFVPSSRVFGFGFRLSRGP